MPPVMRCKRSVFLEADGTWDGRGTLRVVDPGVQKHATCNMLNDQHPSHQPPGTRHRGQDDVIFSGLAPPPAHGQGSRSV